MHRRWVFTPVLSIREAALHYVGNLSSLLFCGAPQEPEEARSVVRCDLTTHIGSDSFCTSDD